MGNEADRQAFRIDDELSVQHRPATPEEVAEPRYEAELPPAKDTEILATMEGIQAGTTPLIQTLRSKDEALGKYLALVDDQLHLVVKTLAEITTALGITLRTQRVNLSETGIAFGTEERFEPGTHLRVQFVTATQPEPVVAFGTVVLSKPTEITNCNDHHHRYWTALNFTQLRPIDRQKIAAHVLDWQKQRHAQRVQDD